MKRHRIIPTVRCLLLALGIALLWPFAPDIACGFCPLLFMPPIFASTSCNACSVAAHSQYQVTLAGITDLGCGDCVANYDATFTLNAVTTTGDSCKWNLTGLNYCYFTGLPATHVDTITMTINNGAATVVVQLTQGATNKATYQNSISPPIDCAFSSYSVTLSTLDLTRSCEFAGSTCQVTAV